VILQRHSNWPNERLSTVSKGWEGRTVVCIATGPSLTAEQVEQVRLSAVPTITVNDAYLMAPFAAVTYFADLKWWKWHKDRAEWKAFQGQKCSIWIGGEMPADTAVYLLRNVPEQNVGLSRNPGAVCTGSNSGYQAINIATLAGAKRVVLLGYDAQSVNGRDHYFGAHPDKSKPPYDAIRIRFREAVAAAKAIGVEILNATPDSKIEAFRKVTLAECLQPPA
jgi:hypothetical protein